MTLNNNICMFAILVVNQQDTPLKKKKKIFKIENFTEIMKNSPPTFHKYNKKPPKSQTRLGL